MEKSFSDTPIMNDSSKFWTAVVVSTALILLDVALILMSAIPMWLF